MQKKDSSDLLIVEAEAGPSIYKTHGMQPSACLRIHHWCVFVEHCDTHSGGSDTTVALNIKSVNPQHIEGVTRVKNLLSRSCLLVECSTAKFLNEKPGNLNESTARRPVPLAAIWKRCGKKRFRFVQQAHECLGG